MVHVIDAAKSTLTEPSDWTNRDESNGPIRAVPVEAVRLREVKSPRPPRKAGGLEVPARTMTVLVPAKVLVTYSSNCSASGEAGIAFDGSAMVMPLAASIAVPALLSTAPLGVIVVSGKFVRATFFAPFSAYGWVNVAATAACGRTVFAP